MVLLSACFVTGTTPLLFLRTRAISTGLFSTPGSQCFLHPFFPETCIRVHHILPLEDVFPELKLPLAGADELDHVCCGTKGLSETRNLSVANKLSDEGRDTYS